MFKFARWEYIADAQNERRTDNITMTIVHYDRANWFMVNVAGIYVSLAIFLLLSLLLLLLLLLFFVIIITIIVAACLLAAFVCTFLLRSRKIVRYNANVHYTRRVHYLKVKIELCDPMESISIRVVFSLIFLFLLNENSSSMRETMSKRTIERARALAWACSLMPTFSYMLHLAQSN